MKLKKVLLCFLTAGLLSGPWAEGQTVDSLAARIYIDPQGNTLPYRLWVPSDYVATASYPLVMYLHGSGGLGTDNRLPLLDPSPLVFIAPTNQVKHPCLMVAPQCPVGSSWFMPAIQHLVLGMMQQIQAEFNVDPDRLYLTGVSMGGYGTWAMISSYPNTFAAAVGICGYSITPYVPAYQLPVWYFHAQDDTTVDIAGGRAMIKAMREAGGTPIYTEYFYGGHGIWTQAYATPPLVDWVMAQRRGQPSALPPSVTLLTPARVSPFSTAADHLALNGSAINLYTNVTKVTWTNNLGGGGTALGTTNWSISALPLKPGTNILTVLAAGTCWVNTGGSTTFNTGLTVIREPPIVLSLACDGLNAILSWTGGVPPFRIETCSSLHSDDWFAVLTTNDRSATIPLDGACAYFRIAGQ